VYSADGCRLASAEGSGDFRIEIPGYRGVAVVRVTSGETTVIKKVAL